MSFVLPHLYVGAALDVADPVQLKKYAVIAVSAICSSSLNKIVLPDYSRCQHYGKCRTVK